MLGVTDGEYLPLTPSLTASLPFAPEYFGWSYLPSSIEKWRCPCPFCFFLPTAAGSSVKSVTLTRTATGFDRVAPSVGLPKATFGPAGLDSWSSSELPQPAATSAPAASTTRTAGL